jgi:hypothetical protein
VFCYQCEQTFRSDEGAGCAGAKGMCGKDAATADLQDILLHVCEGIGQYPSPWAARGRCLNCRASPIGLAEVHGLLDKIVDRGGALGMLVSDCGRVS